MNTNTLSEPLISGATLRIGAPPGSENAAAESGERGDSLTILGVNYRHIRLSDGGELYLTQFGQEIAEHLAPSNWYEPHWFASHRERLPGTSAIFKVPTMPLGRFSVDLVVRFSRVGQQVPVDEATLCRYPNVEFNTPFEEFAVVMELRQAYEAHAKPLFYTTRPLAIYAPAQRLALWQLGRNESKFATKQARHPEARLEIDRPYLLLYGWIDGLNAIQASRALGLCGNRQEGFLQQTTLRAIADLAQDRFRVIDMKPDHIIFPEPFDCPRAERSQTPYALVDYELLERY